LLSTTARQRCLAHRMRNLAAKLPEDVWPEFKVRAQAAYQAPSRAIARELAAGVVADYAIMDKRGKVKSETDLLPNPRERTTTGGR
jgi:hypothetical protein